MKEVTGKVNEKGRLRSIKESILYVKKGIGLSKQMKRREEGMQGNTAG